jgi:hypothetical protein
VPILPFSKAYLEIRIIMASTTHLSDINELSLGYGLQKRWWNRSARGTFNKKHALLLANGVPHEVVANQVGRGQVMAKRVRDYLSSTYADYTIQEVHWCARKGTIAKLFREKSPITGDGSISHPNGAEVSENHPADICVVLGHVNEDGSIGDRFLFGVSAKSTNGYGDCGFKNPGLGSLSTLLSVDFQEPIKTAISEVVARFQLPVHAKARKACLRAGPPEVLEACRDRGRLLRGQVRDGVLKSLGDHSGAFLRAFLETSIIDASPWQTWPRYIKVVGFGNPEDTFDANVYDPFSVHLNGLLTCEAVGEGSVGFRHNGAKLCIVRSKFESLPLASTLKFFAESWTKDTELNIPL